MAVNAVCVTPLAALAVGAEGGVQAHDILTQVLPLASHHSKQLVVVLNINNECAGELMAFRSAVVIRGISKPSFVVPSAATSSMALE
ncbi:MAG: hypothetical protein HPY79_11750 [Bacteroidales bacterium]|nr:hypothetical protein [Bacteroidales bacterium]